MSDIYLIRETLGVDLFRKLSIVKAGKKLSIPAKAKPEGEIAQIIGLEAAEKLSSVIGGTVVHINQSEYMRERNAIIQAMNLAGYRNEEIAKKIGICDRWVRDVNEGLNLKNASAKVLEMMEFFRAYKVESNSGPTQLDLF